MLLLLFGFATFIVLIPLSTAGLSSVSIFNIDYTHDQMKLRFFIESFSPAINFGALIYGALLGTMLFRFLLDKRQTSFMLTLGLTRTSLFLSRYLAGAVLAAVAILSPMLMSLILNIIAFGAATRNLLFFCHLCIGLLTLALNGLAISSAACAVAGTLGESMFFTCALLSLPTSVCYCANVLMRRFLLGSAFGATLYDGTTVIQSNLTEIFSKWNPALFFYKDLKLYSAFYEGINSTSPRDVHFMPTILWLPATALLAFGALRLFRARRAENAGISGLSRTIRHIGLAVPGISLFAAITDALADFQIYAALLAATGAYLIWSLIIHGSLSRRAVMRRQVWTLIHIASIWVFILVLFGGGVGFSAYTPSAQRVASVEASFVGSPAYMGGTPHGSSGGGGFYVVNNYSYADHSDIETVLTLHREIIDSGRHDIGENPVDFSDSMLPYDITFRYTLTDGTVKTRYYDRATASFLARMLTLDGTQLAKQTERSVITGDGTAQTRYWAAGAFEFGEIYLSDNWYSNPLLLSLDDATRAELRECIALDVETQNVEDRYFPDAPPVCVIMFTQNGEHDSRSYKYQLQNSIIYVTEQFVHTLAFLSGRGLYPLPVFDNTVEHLFLQKFEPFGVINAKTSPRSLYFQGYVNTIANDFLTVQDFGFPHEVTDSDKISSLLPLMRNNYFMSSGGYLASVKYAGSDNYVYKFIPAMESSDILNTLTGSAGF